jgi:hypothetical protein
VLTGEADSSFAETYVAVSGQDEVIKALAIEELTRLNNLPGHQNILGRWRGVRCGVIMCDDNARRIEAQGFLIHLADPDLGAVDGAAVDGHHSQEPVLGIQGGDPQLLLVKAIISTMKSLATSAGDLT